MAQAENPPQPRSQRAALFQVMLANALLLSGLYLIAGLTVEVLLHLYPAHWVQTASLIVDSLPARVLHHLGLLPRLTEAYAYAQLSGFWLRAIFAATTVVIIFLLAIFVGALTSAAGWLLERRRGHRPV